MTPSFRLGELLITPAAEEALERSGQHLVDFLHRHIKADWGGLSPEEKEKNSNAARHGGEIRSKYTTLAGEELLIVTAADWRTTTLMMAGEE